MNPDDFDISNLRDRCLGIPLNELPAERDRIAASLCEGCPVIGQCALDAAEPTSVGVVRAGVWVPECGDRSKIAAAARDQFRRIAAEYLTQDRSHAVA